MTLLGNWSSNGGAFAKVQIVRNTSAKIGAGSPANLTSMNAKNAPLSNTTVGFNYTTISDIILRTINYQGGSMYQYSADFNSIMTQVPYATLWNAGQLDINVQPLTCPIGYNCGYGLYSPNATSIVTVDPEIEFTSETS